MAGGSTAVTVMVTLTPSTMLTSIVSVWPTSRMLMSGELNVFSDHKICKFSEHALMIIAILLFYVLTKFQVVHGGTRHSLRSQALGSTEFIIIFYNFGFSSELIKKTI